MKVAVLLLFALQSTIATLITKDCSEFGSADFFTCGAAPNACAGVATTNAAYGQSTCSPRQCTMVGNTAATPPTPSPAECTFTTGTCTGTSTYAYTKAEVFKNMAKKTCNADLSAAAFPSVCSKAALASNFMLAASSADKAHTESGIRLLYCNDEYLVIHTVGVPNHPVGLLGNPKPPGSGKDASGTTDSDYDDQTVTRANVVQYTVSKIPLVPRALSTSDVENNKGRFTAMFTTKLLPATTAITATELTFDAADTTGNIHAGYVITAASGLADKTVTKQCDSAEIVGGTGGVSSTTLTITWTVVGTVCKASKAASTCSDTSAGKYVVISSSYVLLSSCSVVGGVGTCTMASAQTVAAGTTLQVRNSDVGNVVCSLTETTTAAIADSIVISGTHDSAYDLPSYTTVGTKYYPGIPEAGPLAIAVTGQSIFPIYDDQGYTSQEMCEIDMCNGHAGKGFDYHYHGDPYHHTPGVCLYSGKDYSDTVSGHPPLIAYSLDGYKVYGRHLATTNVGYDTAGGLDDCGGHSHGDYGYHYHAQVKQLTSLSGSTLNTASASATYYAPIPGVYKCWRGDIGAQRIFGNQVSFSNRADFEDLKPCGGTNQYWAHSSIKDITDSNTATSLAAAFTNYKGTSTWASSSFSFTFTSAYTADQISSSTTLKTAIKTALASALVLDVADIFSVVATASRRQADRDLGAGHGLGRGGLGGLVVNEQHASRKTTQSVKITATVASAYTATTLAAAYTSYSSVFTASFASSTASYTYAADPTAAPAAAPETLSATNTIIIGVVVGVGGFLLIVGGGLAYYFFRGVSSKQADADSKMPVESSSHQHQTHGHAHGHGHGHNHEVELAMSLTHADDGHARAHGAKL